MSERPGQTGRINLGGNALVQIVKGLEELGWQTADGLAGLNLDTMMIWGNGNQGEFWHQPLPVVQGTVTTIRGPHRDLLVYDHGLLRRECPIDGQKVVSSTTVRR